MEHISDLPERIRDLLFDEGSSDVTFIVGGESLPAHRAILITSCKRFRTLFRKEGMKEPTKNEVVLKDVSLTVFKLLMEYTYTGRFIMTKLNTDSIFDVLEVAHDYEFTRLESTICQYLKKTLSIEKVCAIYNKAHSLTLEELIAECKRLMYKEPNSTMRSEDCCHLSEAALLELLLSDSFCADEIEIFEAVVRWCEKHPRQEDRSNVLAAVRLPLIDTKDLVTTVKNSGLFTTDILVDAIRTKTCEGADLNFRGWLINGINLARRDQEALTLTALSRGDFVTANTCPGYKSNKMPSKKCIEVSVATGLTVALLKPFWVNFIGFRFVDETFTCSYNIEVSLNLVDWARIIDHSEYICRASQVLYFKDRVVRYIRLNISGQLARGKVIKLSELKVKSVLRPPKLSRGFYIPRVSVVTKALGATVIESSGDSNELINDESKWISHKIGKGAIVIHLTQPVVVKSMRMLLKNDDSRAYRYYIETSLDKKTWIRVADHTTSLCRSWQNVNFEELPVLFIRIVGTASTADEFFSCANFECPASKSTAAECPAPESEAKVDAAARA